MGDLGVRVVPDSFFLTYRYNYFKAGEVTTWFVYKDTPPLI